MPQTGDPGDEKEESQVAVHASLTPVDPRV